MPRYRSAPLGLIVAAALSARTTALAQPSISNLGTLPGSDATAPFAISADGTTVVGAAIFGQLERACRWTAATGLQDLGLLHPTDATSRATGVSGDGTVITGYGSPAFEPFIFATRPFIRIADAPLEELGPFPDGFSAFAQGISRDGTTVVGSISRFDLSGESYGGPFRWTRAGGVESIPDPDPVWGASTGAAVNADGSCIVGTSAGYAFRWVLGSGSQWLGEQPIGNSIARAVSDDGSVVLGSVYDFATNFSFRWTEATGMEGLRIPPDALYATALAMNSDATVIAGVCHTLDDTDRAFLWRPGSGMLDLHLYLHTRGVDLTGWQLTGVSGLSADASAMTGGGFFDGQVAAWIVTGLPPPCAADFNADASVNSQDLFAFLAAFFTSDPAADVNADHVVNSQDLFDFLAAFFNGC